MCIPIYQQVLFHSEAFCASVAVGPLMGSPDFGLGVVTVTVALRQLCQLILRGAEGPRLLPDAGRVDNQAVL